VEGMKFLVTVEQDLPGLKGEGKTPEEALAGIQKAIENAINKRRRDGHDPAAGILGPDDIAFLTDEAIMSIQQSIEEIVRARRNQGLPTADIQIHKLEIEV